jgi:hypothetical protein
MCPVETRKPSQSREQVNRMSRIQCRINEANANTYWIYPDRNETAMRIVKLHQHSSHQYDAVAPLEHY